MDWSISPNDEILFLRVCHHISNSVYVKFITVPAPHSGNDYKRLNLQRLDLTKKWEISLSIWQGKGAECGFWSGCKITTRIKSFIKETDVLSVRTPATYTHRNVRHRSTCTSYTRNAQDQLRQSNDHFPPSSSALKKGCALLHVTHSH